MSIRYKIERVLRWKPVVGFWEALRFEIAWSCRPHKVRVRIPSYPEPFWLRRASTDLSVFETAFINREFAAYLPEEPRLIIDGGANVGLSTAFYANAFPRARVVAVEPAGDNVAMLRTNTRGFRNVVVVEGGLWPVSGFLRIANPDDAAWSFRCESAAESSTAIRAHTITEIIRLSGFDHCDLLKLDIEGAEEQLFDKSEDWLELVDAILVEVHGERALAAVRAACPLGNWRHQDCGEKLLLTRCT